MHLLFFLKAALVSCSVSFIKLTYQNVLFSFYNNHSKNTNTKETGIFTQSWLNGILARR